MMQTVPPRSLGEHHQQTDMLMTALDRPSRMPVIVDVIIVSLDCSGVERHGGRKLFITYRQFRHEAGPTEPVVGYVTSDTRVIVGKRARFLGTKGVHPARGEKRFPPQTLPSIAIL